jgi:hypothetical protein
LDMESSEVIKMITVDWEGHNGSLQPHASMMWVQTSSLLYRQVPAAPPDRPCHLCVLSIDQPTVRWHMHYWWACNFYGWVQGACPGE